MSCYNNLLILYCLLNSIRLGGPPHEAQIMHHHRFTYHKGAKSSPPPSPQLSCKLTLNEPAIKLFSDETNILQPLEVSVIYVIHIISAHKFYVRSTCFVDIFLLVIIKERRKQYQHCCMLLLL